MYGSIIIPSFLVFGQADTNRRQNNIETNPDYLNNIEIKYDDNNHFHFCTYKYTSIQCIVLQHKLAVHNYVR